MRHNLEVKARAHDLLKQKELCVSAGAFHQEECRQTDLFFSATKGKLKLRITAEDEGELIYYNKTDGPLIKKTSYVIFPTSDTESLKTVLKASLHYLGEVRKIRSIYKRGKTRIHFDRVEGLGEFIEFEHPVENDVQKGRAPEIIQELMVALDITDEDLLEKSYIEQLKDENRSDNPFHK